MRIKATIVLMWFVCARPVLAQQSPSFKLIEQAFNAGGHPTGGVVQTSANFRITLDAVGEEVTMLSMASSSFHMDAGFVSRYPPPQEVHNLQFPTDKATLSWNVEKSVGGYDIHRDFLAALPGLQYGACLLVRLPDETTTDSDTPPVGQGFFYLVAAENHLWEHGTKGFRSNGVERQGTVCP